MDENQGPLQGLEDEVMSTLKHWWLFILIGLLGIGIGIWILCNTGKAYVALSIFFAITFIIAGIASCWITITNRKLIPAWGWQLCSGIIMLVLGSLSALGYGPLARFTVFGMQFLDFFDFLTNSVMMPIAAITICLLVSRVIGVEKIEEEVTLEGKPFRRKRIFNFMIKYLCPIFAAVILISSVANALGVISM